MKIFFVFFQEQKDIEAKEKKRQEAMQPKHQPTPIPEEGGDERRVSGPFNPRDSFI